MTLAAPISVTIWVARSAIFLGGQCLRVPESIEQAGRALSGAAVRCNDPRFNPARPETYMSTSWLEAYPPMYGSSWARQLSLTKWVEGTLSFSVATVTAACRVICQPWRRRTAKG